MSDNSESTPSRWREANAPRGLFVKALLRSIASTAALVAIYYLAPLDRSSSWVGITMLAVGLATLIALVTFHVFRIYRSSFPGVRAFEALAVDIPFYVLLFAATYVVMSTISAGSFSQPLSHTNALYFAMTVFSTVGFGDIVAKTEPAQILVTVQMVANLVIIGVVIKVITGAVQERRRRVRPGAGSDTPSERQAVG
jgi:voltage-gated potassium channel